MTETKLVCKNIWKIFGKNPEKILANHDQSKTRSQIQVETGHVIAVKDVSFDVKKGECFVVMGLSGSGKSTLVRCISRLIEPTGGQVLIDGADVTNMKKQELRDLRRYKTAMVFQHFGLFPHRKVIDNISYGLEIRGTGKSERIEKAMEILKLVGLDGWDQMYPRELSGGMQQRVGLARAMAVDPEILIFDEPFSALDPLIRREMQDELLELQGKLQKTQNRACPTFLRTAAKKLRRAFLFTCKNRKIPYQNRQNPENVRGKTSFPYVYKNFLAWKNENVRI